MIGTVNPLFLLHFDLLEAAERKLAANAAKYPVDRVRGQAKKYNEY